MVSFRRVITLALALAAISGAAFGQTTAPITFDPSTYSIPRCVDSNANAVQCPPAREIVAFTGAAYNQQGSPKVTWTLGGAYPVSDSAYVGVVADVAFSRLQQPSVTVRPEYIHALFKVNGHPIYGLAGIGASFVASDPAAVIQQILPTIKAALENVGANVGYSAATGVTTTFHLGRGFHLAPAFRVVKGSLNDTHYVVGLNVATKIRVERR